MIVVTFFRRLFGGSPATSSGRNPHVRAAGLLVVLGLALLATVALTAQALIASRAQRRAAEDAVRDYARFAANNYATDAQRALRQTALAIFSWLGGKSSRLEADSLYDVRILQDRNRLLAIMQNGVFHKPPPPDLAQQRRVAA